jgi:hypothetical protein
MNDALTIAAAYGALLASAVSVVLAARSTREAHRQADLAEHAIAHAKQSGQVATVIHFTSRFFDLMKEGEHFEDRDWTYQFWSLQATEYYFFDNAWLPSFMYELWMVEMVAAYCADPAVWRSHEQYLTRYSSNYPTMLSFFTGLAEIATQSFESDHDRNATITGYVAAWPSRSASVSGSPGTHQATPSARSSTTDERGAASSRTQR